MPHIQDLACYRSTSATIEIVDLLHSQSSVTIRDLSFSDLGIRNHELYI